MKAEAGGFCGIQRGGADGVLQTPASEGGYVADGEVHGEDAAGKFSVHGAAAVFDLHLQRAELVSSFGHAGGGGRIGDEHGAVNAFRLQKNLDNFWGNVNAIGNDVGGELSVGEDLGENTGLAMVERAHGVEGVGGVAGAGFRASAGGLQRGVGVADAHQNLAARGFRDHFESSGKFGSDGHHADVAARGLPEAIENLQRGLDQVRGGMHAAALVAEERAFEVNAQGESLRLSVERGKFLRGFDGVGDALESGADLIERRGHGGGEVSGDAVGGEEMIELWKF